MKNQSQSTLLPPVQPDPAQGPKFKVHGSKLKRRPISFARLRWILAASSCCIVFFSGCTITSYTSPSGERFTRSSLGANTSLHSLAFEANTNGLRRVRLQGYQEDNSQALGVVTEAAVRGALSAAKP